MKTFTGPGPLSYFLLVAFLSMAGAGLVILILMLAPGCNTAWAGEREEAALKVQMLQERVWRLEAQWQLMQRVLPETLSALEAARKAAADLEKKKAEPPKE